ESGMLASHYTAARSPLSRPGRDTPATPRPVRVDSRALACLDCNTLPLAARARGADRTAPVAPGARVAPVEHSGQGEDTESCDFANDQWNGSRHDHARRSTRPLRRDAFLH